MEGMILVKKGMIWFTEVGHGKFLPILCTYFIFFDVTVTCQ